MNSHTIDIIITIFCSVMASSGLWAYATKRFDKTSAQNEMLVGLAHDRIIEKGCEYIARDPQYITQQEYENLKVYLFEPYTQLGGNGTAAKIMSEVERLPIREKGDSKNEDDDE